MSQNKSVAKVLGHKVLKVNEQGIECSSCGERDKTYYYFDDPDRCECADCLMEDMVVRYDMVDKTELSVDHILEQRARVGRAMEARGGGFVQRLGGALLRADIENAVRIYTAFPEYWKTYQKLALDCDL